MMVYSHRDFKYIDSHTHFFPPNLFKAIWDYFEFPEANGHPRGWQINYKMSIDELVNFLLENNVFSFTTFNYAHKKGIAENINEWTYQFTQEHQNSIGFGCCWPGDANKLEYMTRCFDNFNFYGLKLQLLVQNFYPNDPRMHEIYHLTIDRGKWVNFHCGTAPYSNEFVGYEHFIKVMENFPDMKVIVAHFGAYEYEKFFKLLDKYENLYFDSAMVYIPLDIFKKWKSELYHPRKELIISYQDRILYGSDFPNIPYDYPVSTKGLFDLDLEKSIYKKIFYENAKKVFNLDINL
jgi:predicted TIM-barrel fold metal-dependent hydrolase